MSDGGKGSAPRPFSVDRKTFENNWDMIFKKPSWDHYSDLPNPDAYTNDYQDILSTEDCVENVLKDFKPNGTETEQTP
jgi:capsular polysaccharide biosynthesis protein